MTTTDDIVARVEIEHVSGRRHGHRFDRWGDAHLGLPEQPFDQSLENIEDLVARGIFKAEPAVGDYVRIVLICIGVCARRCIYPGKGLWPI